MGPAAALTTPCAALRRMFTWHVPLTTLRQNYPMAGMHGRGRDVSCWPTTSIAARCRADTIGGLPDMIATSLTRRR
jgi:hypothetical protein